MAVIYILQAKNANYDWQLIQQRLQCNELGLRYVNFCQFSDLFLNFFMPSVQLGDAEGDSGDTNTNISEDANLKMCEILSETYFDN